MIVEPQESIARPQSGPLRRAALHDAEDDHAAVTRGITEAESRGIQGKALTPWLLQRVAELTGGESRTANLALLRQNASLAAEIEVKLTKS